MLVRPEGLIFGEWLKLSGATPAERKWIAMLGIDDPQERARMLRLGFGDVLACETSLDELEQRILRLAERAQALPRFRSHGPIRLDLLAREAFVSGRALGLHPREFALLWRLADSQGQPVRASELISDVWRLSFRPETNSLAVHVSRLRAKLRLAGLGGLIETLPDGSYRLVAEARPPIQPSSSKLPLDAHLRFREERDEHSPMTRQDDQHVA